jgi:uncharacterized protein (TIGR03790 family)
MSRISAIAALSLLVLTGARAADSETSPEAAATLVIYNRQDQASTALAKYYAGQRHIPEAQLVGLSCSKEEEISRGEYLATIEKPLREKFSDAGWWKISLDADGHRYVQTTAIRFVALIRGVPMKIRPEEQKPSPSGTADTPPSSPAEVLLRHSEASVDSELAALFMMAPDIAGPLANPYYRRFAHIMDIAPGRGPLLVCRLDGPSDAVVRRMIDSSIAAEKSGLWGWAYLDARGVKDPAYIEGDEWITRAGDLMRRHGIPVISDYAPETFPEGFPIRDAAIYYGWYAANVEGPFVRPDFLFSPGAIAVHLHSFSATTIRDPKVAWAGPLLAHGAAATLGNVYEPYLSLTVNFDILQDRLMNGLNLAEASYAATRGLSWMNVVLGDPLYRPYASWNSLDSDGPPNLWQRYRDIVLQAGDPVAAAGKLRKLAADAHSSMPLEALGQAQGAAQQFDAALQTLSDAAGMEKSDTIRFRIALEQIELLRRAARIDAALEKISDALAAFKSDDQQVTLGKLVLILKPPAPPKSDTK